MFVYFEKKNVEKKIEFLKKIFQFFLKLWKTINWKPFYLHLTPTPTHNLQFTFITYHKLYKHFIPQPPFPPTSLCCPKHVSLQ